MKTDSVFLGTIGFKPRSVPEKVEVRLPEPPPESDFHRGGGIVSPPRRKGNHTRKRAYDPELERWADVVCPPYKGKGSSYRSLAQEKRWKDSTFHCAIFPGQLSSPPVRKKNRRERQRKNRKLKRRLAAITRG